MLHIISTNSLSVTIHDKNTIISSSTRKKKQGNHTRNAVIGFKIRRKYWYSD